MNNLDDMAAVKANLNLDISIYQEIYYVRGCILNMNHNQNTR